MMDPFIPPAAKLEHESKLPQSGKTKSILSITFGILGLGFWLFPLIGIPMTVCGLVLGAKTLDGPLRGLSIAGVILCGVDLFLGAVNSALGAYVGATGDYELMNRLLRK